jgi:hypothetical protein
MKAALTFTTAMVLGFAATLLAQPSQSTNSNEISSSRTAEARFSPDGKQLVTIEEVWQRVR